MNITPALLDSILEKMQNESASQPDPFERGKDLAEVLNASKMFPRVMDELLLVALLDSVGALASGFATGLKVGWRARGEAGEVEALEKMFGDEGEKAA